MQCINIFLVLTITTFVFINSFTIAKAVNNKLKNKKNENWFLSKLSFNRQSIYNYHQNSKTTCKKVDYCLLKNKSSRINKKICDNLGLNCISNENTESFECICDKNNTRWDVLSNSCLPLKIECKINESFKVIEGKPGCYCNNGYSKQNNTCVEHDPCNNDRQLSLCKDINAKCNKIGLQKTDFQCKCTKNYYNEFENKNSLARCLPIQCKHCEQTCKLDIQTKVYNCDCIDKTKYKLEKDKCILKQGVSDIECRGNQTEQWINKGYPTAFLTGSSCACPQNFYFDNQRKVCEIQSQVDFVFGCSKVELKSDKLPGCVCLHGQKFDFLTRKCLPQCDEKSEKFCQEREGQCVVSTSKVKCQCKPGFAAFSADLKNTENFICLNKCMLFNRPELTQYKCYKMFSQCDPTKVTYSGPLREVFIFNISKITTAQIDHCKCEIGFQFDKLLQECVPSLDPVQYIKDMDFLLDSSMISQSKKRLHTETIIKQAFISLIITLFEKINLESVKCQPSGDKAICTAAIYTKMTIKKVKMKLENACQFLSKTNMCYYMTKQSNFTKKLIFESVLKRTKNEVFIEPINYCSNQNRCSFATYSNCQTKIINSIELFECICNSTIFTVTSQTNIRLFNQKDSLRMQNCQLKDLCDKDKVNYGCEDQSATCHLTAEMRGNQYIAKSFCSCPSTGLVLPDQKRKCANSCDRYCLHGNCTTDILSGTMICQCQNGFSGPRCNFTVQEIQTNKKVSKGYKIATIIFLVIISLTLICVIFGLVKKHTKFNFKMIQEMIQTSEKQKNTNHSNHQQSDFSMQEL